MKFNKTDLNHSRNMLKVLGKGKWELEGMEILAFAAMMQWFSKIQKDMEMEIAQEEAQEQARAAAAKAANNPAAPLVPKPVEDPVKTSIAKPPRKTKEK